MTHLPRSAHRAARGPLPRALVRFACCLALGLCPGAGVAFGQEAAPAEPKADAATLATARALAVQGIKLAQASRCPEAIDHLERAEALHHSAIVAEQLGTCYLTLGRLVEGTELLRGLLREPLPENASASLQRAYARANEGLAAEKPRIAKLTLSTVGAASGATTVSFDGQPVPQAMLGAARPTDPGEHIVEATAQGFETVRTRVLVGPGETRELSILLKPLPAAKRVAAASSAPQASGAAASNEASVVQGALPNSSPADPSAQLASASGQGGNGRIAAYTLWGVGAVSLAVGTGLGISALNAKNDIAGQCNGDICSSSARGRLDDGKRAGTISTVGFAVGAAAVIVGTAVFFVTRGKGTETRRTAGARGERRPSIALDTSGGTLGLSF